MNVTITCRLVDFKGHKDRYQLLLSMDGCLTPEVSFDAFKSCVMKALNEHLPDEKVFLFVMSLDFRNEFIESEVVDGALKSKNV